MLVGVRSRASAGEVSGVGGVRSRASAREVSVACSRRRWKLAVTCACVVCHCACVLALPMGAIPSGGLHLLGRIARDQLGLNLPDRVFRLIGNKPRLGAGRPSSPCHCRRFPTGVCRPPAYPRPRNPYPCNRAPSATPYRPLSAHAEQSRASGGALDPLGSMTPGVMVGVLQH